MFIRVPNEKSSINSQKSWLKWIQKGINLENDFANTYHTWRKTRKTVMLSSKFHLTSKTSINHSILAVNGKHQPFPIFCHHHKPKQTTTTTPWPVRLAYHSNPNISALDESALRVAWHRIQLQKHLEHLEAKNWCFGSMFLLSQRLAFFMWTSGVFWGLQYISKKWSTSSRLTGGYKDDIRRSRKK